MPPETSPPAAPERPTPAPAGETSKPFFNLTEKALRSPNLSDIVVVPTAALIDISYGTVSKLAEWGKKAGVAVGKLIPGAAILGYKGGKFSAEKFLQFIYDGTVKVSTPALKAALDTAIIGAHTAIHLPADLLKLGIVTPIKTVVGSTRAAIAGAMMLGGVASNSLKSSGQEQWKQSKALFKDAFDFNLTGNTRALFYDYLYSAFDTAAQIPQTYTELVGWDSATEKIKRINIAVKKAPIIDTIFGTRKNMMENLFQKDVANDNEVVKKAA